MATAKWKFSVKRLLDADVPKWFSAQKPFHTLDLGRKDPQSELDLEKYYQRIGLRLLRENLQETIDFSIKKCGVFL
jgi:hypothetical protein